MNRQQLIESLKNAKSNGLTTVDLRSSTDVLQAEYDRLFAEDHQAIAQAVQTETTPSQIEDAEIDALVEQLKNAMNVTGAALEAMKAIAPNWYEIAKTKAVEKLTIAERRQLIQLSSAGLINPFFAQALKGQPIPHDKEEADLAAGIYLHHIRQHLQSWKVATVGR